MRATIDDVQLTSAIAAKDGWAQIAASDYGRAGQIIRAQYGYLQRFAEQLEAGLPIDGRFLPRTALYGQAGRRTFHLVERREMAERGLTEARSVPASADHCATCVSEAAAGWRPAGEIVPIGHRQYMSNCRCTIGDRNPASGERAA